jgi:uncharacterized membrane protein
VLFIMISNHFAMTYRHDHAWLVLAAIMLAGVFIRHFFNLRHKGRIEWKYPAIGRAAAAGDHGGDAPKPPASPAIAAGAPAAQFAQVKGIIDQRCVSCHARIRPSPASPPRRPA